MTSDACLYRSQLAVQIVYEDARLKKAWKYALLWLNSELERVSFSVLLNCYCAVVFDIETLCFYYILIR